jgi:hypothetical protein
MPTPRYPDRLWPGRSCQDCASPAQAGSTYCAAHQPDWVATVADPATGPVTAWMAATWQGALDAHRGLSLADCPFDPALRQGEAAIRWLAGWEIASRAIAARRQRVLRDPAPGAFQSDLWAEP